MIILLQILKLLNAEQRTGLLDFFENPDESFGPDELADSAEDFLSAHYDIVLELTHLQREMLSRVLANQTYKSAFKIAEIA